jgi:outer membrane murein-binding lipoprotein Lpp
MPQKIAIIVATSASLITLAGCAAGAGDSKLAEENIQLKAKVDVLQSENQQLQSKLVALQAENIQAKTQSASQPNQPAAKTDTAAPNAVADGSPPSTSGAPSGPSAAKATSFTDIAGIDGAEDIRNLATVGVLDGKGGNFDPAKPISRAQYVCWLVTTNNLYFADQPNNKIHLAGAGDTSTFVDVPSSNAAFKWIQGMANSGYVVGVDAKHFAPNQAITREQMIAIKAQVDEGAPIPSNSDQRHFIPVSDVGEIDFSYLGPVYEDYSARTTNNIGRIWGSTKVFHPKKPVTRAEAAVSLSKIGGNTYRHGSAADVLKNSNG